MASEQTSNAKSGKSSGKSKAGTGKKSAASTRAPKRKG